MFDGFPRNVVQAEALDEALAARGAQIDHALLISVARRGTRRPPRRPLDLPQLRRSSTTNATTRRRSPASATSAAASSTSATTTAPRSSAPASRSRSRRRSSSSTTARPASSREIDGERSLDAVTAAPAGGHRSSDGDQAQVRRRNRGSCARPAGLSARRSQQIRAMIRPGLNLLEIEALRPRGVQAARRRSRRSCNYSPAPQVSAVPFEHLHQHQRRSSSTASRATATSRKATSSPSTSARPTRATSAIRPSRSPSAKSAPKRQRLIEVTEDALWAGIKAAAHGQPPERHLRRDRGRHHARAGYRHRPRIRRPRRRP